MNPADIAAIGTAVIGIIGAIAAAIIAIRSGSVASNAHQTATQAGFSAMNAHNRLDQISAPHVTEKDPN